MLSASELQVKKTASNIPEVQSINSFLNENFQQYKFKMSNPGLSHFASFSFEIQFEAWKPSEDMAKSFPTLSPDKIVKIFEILSSNGQSMFSLLITGSFSSANSNSESAGTGFYLKVEVGGKAVDMSGDVALTPNDISPPAKFNEKTVPISKIPINKNSKFIMYIQQMDNNRVKLHLFVINNNSETEDQIISQYVFLSDANSKILFKNGTFNILSDSVNKLQNFQLKRFIISDSLGDLLSHKIKSKLSSVANTCSHTCLLGGLIKTTRKFKESVRSFDISEPISNQICWACPSLMLFEVESGHCVGHCMLGTKNVFGNCESCLFSDCSDARNKLRYSMSHVAESGVDKLTLTPSIPYLEFDEKIYSDNFEVFRSDAGEKFQKVSFTTATDNKTETGTFIISQTSEIINKPNTESPTITTDEKPVATISSRILQITTPNDKSEVAVVSTNNANSRVYKIVLKDSAEIIDSNRNLVYFDPLTYRVSKPVVTLAYMNDFEAQPVSPKAFFMPIPAPVTDAHKNLYVSSDYKACFPGVDDQVLNSLAIALYIIFLIIVVIFVLFVLLCWNKFLPFQFQTAGVHMFMHSVFVFQAVTFSVFYQFDIPPSLDLFLRHLYRVSTKWHGAFRNQALEDYSSDFLFNYNYYRVIRKKHYELSVVQNIFINYGLILLLFAILWLISIVFYFLFLRKKSGTFKKMNNLTKQLSAEEKTVTNNLKKEERETIGKHKKKKKYYSNNSHESGKKRISKNKNMQESFMTKLARSFAFLLAFTFSLSFTIEVMFYILFEFDNSDAQHSFFLASLIFSIIFFIIHLGLIGFTVYYPIKYKSDLLPKMKPIPDVVGQINPNKDKAVKKHKDKLERVKKFITEKHNDISLLKNFHCKDRIWPYSFLFIVQGLNFGGGRQFFMGISLILYFLYTIILTLIPVPGHVAVIINFCIVLVLFVLCVLRPFVDKIQNIILIVGYLLFFIGYLLLMIIGVSDSRSETQCNLGFAVLAFFFAACIILMLGVIYALINFFKTNKIISNKDPNMKETTDTSYFIESSYYSEEYENVKTEVKVNPNPKSGSLEVEIISKPKSINMFNL